MTHRLSSPPPLARDPLAQSHCSCTLLAHVVWSTDRRVAVLGRRFEPWLRDMMTAKAIEAGSRLLGLGVADDHVHSLLRFPSTVTLAAVVQRLKGASSYECNHQQLLPQRLRWQRGYWAETVAPDAVVPLIQYLATQREHHACQPMSVLFDGSDAVCCEPAVGGLEAP
jgi:REP element-mobilizing transposase RayT